MKRAPLKRKTPLQRSSVRLERTPLRRSNPQRRATRYERNYGVRGDDVRAMPCTATIRRPELSSECQPPMEAAHAKSRGAGGDRRELVPLCFTHHAEMHRRGIRTFEAKILVRLRDEAMRIAALLDERGRP